MTHYGYTRAMKEYKLTNTHIRINSEEADKAVKKAQRKNPEQNLSSLIRALVRKFLSGEVEI
jgi:hypothetical protein